MNVRALAAIAVLAAALGCASPGPEETAAAARAVSDAHADLARGRPRLAVIGLFADDRSALDPATGRVRFSVGCCTTREAIAYRDAYNATVQAAPDLGALTLQRKSTSRAAMDAALAGAITVRRGGDTAESPGGRFRIEVAPGEGRDAVALWCRETATGRRESLRYLGSDEARVAFGGDGATLFVRDDAVRASFTCDLPTGLFLEVFLDARPER